MSNAKTTNNPYDRHPMLEQLSQLWRNKTAVIGLFIISVFILTAIFAPLLSPHDPLETSLYDQLKPPVWHEKGKWKNIRSIKHITKNLSVKELNIESYIKGYNEAIHDIIKKLEEMKK